jgi:formylglycine-generating enzyme required for sulfatase activity
MNSLNSPQWGSGGGADEHGHFADYKVREVEFRFRWVPAGTFQMGASAQEVERIARPSETPRHSVSLTRGFWMGETQITQEQWLLFATANRSKFKGAKRPLCGCSWYEAQEFCHRFSEAHNLAVRLPTEAEWEYACRAGTQSAFNDGSAVIGVKVDTPALRDLAIYKGTSRGEWDAEHEPREVGIKRPNRWGLYDMHGNVDEWCRDNYSEYTGDAREDPVVISDSLSSHIARGGNYMSWAYECRSAMRRAYDSDLTLDTLGLRIVIDAEPCVPPCG